MTRWTDHYQNHPFQLEWTRLLEVIERPIPDEANAPAGVVQEFARLRKVVAYVRGLVENLDPELLPPGYIGNLHTYVNQINNELTNFLANGNLGHLQNANANADHLIASAIQSPFTALALTPENLTRAAVDYAATIDRHAQDYTAKIDRLVADASTKLSQLDTDVGNGRAKLDALDTKVGAVETTVQAQLANFNATFQTGETSRTEKYDQWLLKFQEKSDGNFVELVKRNDAALKVLEDFQAQAERVLGTVIDTAQAGAYAKYASEEKSSANRYRIAAILLMALAALVLFLPELAHAVQAATAYTVDWQKALARLPFSLILFAPALYLAKESSKHRTNEVVNRRRQHILTTIGPYLALLDEKKSQEIKAEVAKSIFSDVSYTEEKSDEAANLIGQLTNLAKALAVKR